MRHQSHGDHTIMTMVTLNLGSKSLPFHLGFISDLDTPKLQHLARLRLA